MVNQNKSNLLHIWHAYLDSARRAYQQGNIDEAERELKSNLAQLESIVHDRQLVMSEVIFELANIYREKDNFAAAEHYYQWAFELRVDEDKVPAVSPILEQLSLTFAMQGKYEEALRTEQMFCNISPDNMSGDREHSLLRSAILCRLMGKLSEAAAYFGRYLEWANTHLPPADPALLTVREMCARCLYQLRDYERSEQQYRQIIEIKEQSGTADDEQLRRALNAQGLALCAMELHGEGQAACQRATKLGKTCGDAQTLNDLADVFCEQEKFFEARPLCELAVATSFAGAGDGDGNLASPPNSVDEHARLLAAVGMNEEAEVLWRYRRKPSPVAV